MSPVSDDLASWVEYWQNEAITSLVKTKIKLILWGYVHMEKRKFLS